MGTLTKEYVYLDGMYLKEEQLLKLALNVGDFAHAEHYLCALLAYGVVNGKKTVIDRVNEVREHYGVPAIPTPEHDDADDDGMRQGDSVDDRARSAFLIMDDEERKEVLRRSLKLLRSQYHLFRHSIHWLGIYLVVRDRLVGEGLKMRGFISYSREVMPTEWPASLTMNENTYKNVGKLISYEDRHEAYFDMDNNPQKELCDRFWEIVKQQIFTV